jgi:hypothetical protein
MIPSGLVNTSDRGFTTETRTLNLRTIDQMMRIYRLFSDLIEQKDEELVRNLIRV